MPIINNNNSRLVFIKHIVIYREITKVNIYAIHKLVETLAVHAKGTSQTSCEKFTRVEADL